MGQTQKIGKNTVPSPQIFFFQQGALADDHALILSINLCKNDTEWRSLIGMLAASPVNVAFATLCGYHQDEKTISPRSYNFP